MKSEIEIRQMMGDLQSHSKGGYRNSGAFRGRSSITLGSITVPNNANNFRIINAVMSWAIEEDVSASDSINWRADMGRRVSPPISHYVNLPKPIKPTKSRAEILKERMEEMK